MAYKVTANSLYGQMGARTSPLYLKHIAACTTAVGRAMILQAKAFVEGPEVGGRVVYGDSVAPWTPVWLRLGGYKVVLTTAGGIDDALVVLASPWRAMGDDGKESLDLIDVEVWSDAGWTRARRLIRHRLAADKRMFRVATRLGVVDVTADHSLIGADGTVVKTTDARVGDRLMHAPRGSRAYACSYACYSGKKVGLAHELGRAALEVDCCVPQEVAGSTEEGVRRAYLDGLLKSACGSRVGDSIAVRNQRFAADVFSLAESVGWDPRVASVTQEDDRAIVRLELGSKLDDDDDKISSIEEICGIVTFDAEGRPEAAPYVYDFTTESGRFAAGVGRIVVHNTDSIFVVFKNEDGGGAKLVGRDALASSIRQGQAASKGIKPQLAPPHNLEYEKTMFPLVLLSKKRYVGLLYENDADAKPKQKSMGIALKRRDYAPIVKQVRNFSLLLRSLKAEGRYAA